MAEWDWGKDSRWGLSGLYTLNDYRTRNMGAVHSRLGFEGDSAFLGQLGFIREDPLNNLAKLGGYWFGQYSAGLSRGLHVMMTTEYYTQDWTAATARRFRAGPSVQWLPMQRLELRLDALATRSTGASSLEDDTLTLQSQVHVWL